MAERPRVVILGGGFAGIGAAKQLKGVDADVLLVDEHDYHTFQPLLYQVATDLLDPSTVGHPLRDLFHDQPNTRIRKAKVTGVDLGSRQVRLAGGKPLAYDYLVLALGAVVNEFGIPGAGEHAFPMYTLADAVRLKEHIIERWEAADRDRSLIKDGALNVVIVGGGPTGVESAGALIELYRTNLAKDYPDVPKDRARVILVEAGDAVLSMFKKKLQTYTKKALEERGVQVRLGEIVEAVEPTRVRLKSGDVLKAHTLVWGAGLLGNPVAHSLGVELERGNRLAVGPDLRLMDHPEVFAAGDIAWITDQNQKKKRKGKVLPQLGSVAMQAGERAGRNIARTIRGEPTKPFAYLDKGTMATIGRRAAVMQLPTGQTMKGTSAWLAWGAVHLTLLSTGEDRARAVVDWTWAGFTHERPGRIVVDADD